MAIAFDAASGSTGTVASSVTWAHTCGATADILWVAVTKDGLADTLTGVTYNGVAMTRAHGVALESQGFVALYVLFAPTTGANNVVVSFSNSPGNSTGAAASYSGAQQSGVPDGTNSGSHGFGAGNVTIATTTTVDNAWVVMAAWALSGSVTIAAGTGATLRNSQVTPGGMRGAILDSGAAVTPAGAYSMTFTISDASTAGGVTSGFPPAGVAAGGQPTMRRWGGVPYMGGQGIGNKGGGRMWGRTRDGIYVPRRFAA